MKKSFLISGWIIAAGAIIMMIVFYLRMPKTAFVEINTVYNDFQMKKEREAELTHVQQARKTVLDSLEVQLTVLSRSLESAYKAGNKLQEEKLEQYRTLQQEYNMKRDAFAEDNNAAAEKYNEEIWKQLNQYIKDYGKANGYTYLFGADGSGTLMHGDESINITAEVKGYVNERYKGAGK